MRLETILTKRNILSACYRASSVWCNDDIFNCCMEQDMTRHLTNWKHVKCLNKNILFTNVKKTWKIFENVRKSVTAVLCSTFMPKVYDLHINTRLLGLQNRIINMPVWLLRLIDLQKKNIISLLHSRPVSPQHPLKTNYRRDWFVALGLSYLCRRRQILLRPGYN